MMRHADLAMYHAKETGKNDFAYFSKALSDNDFAYFSKALSDEAESKMNLESELRIALKNDQFETYFRPRVDVSTTAIVGAEALARRNHPTQSLVQPGDFITVCGESGLIAELGKRIFTRAVVAQRMWAQQGYDIHISLILITGTI